MCLRHCSSYHLPPPKIRLTYQIKHQQLQVLGVGEQVCSEIKGLRHLPLRVVGYLFYDHFVAFLS